MQPDAAADLPPGRSRPAPSPPGSISANRGAVNEAAQIVTRGESGAAVIGVSGYNGAFSNENYVLRVKVTPPPTLPPCDPITGLGTATPGTLPAVPGGTTRASRRCSWSTASVSPASTAQPRADALLGTSSRRSTRSRPTRAWAAEILPVDGNASVRNAYATWDQNPCSIDAANGVVRSINALVASYRPKYPNLKYVVLLGTDTALPSWRQQDLTSTSPEVDEANDLAFTTSGLTKGNAIYAAAAQNAVPDRPGLRRVQGATSGSATTSRLRT